MGNFFFFFIFFSIGHFQVTPNPSDTWKYSWRTRLDRYNKPAGIYIETPFPIDESTTEYSIITDEGIRTYHIAHKVFVDGGFVGTESGTFSNPFSTLTAALASITTTSGTNTAIVVRGSHDSFNGIYNIPSNGISLSSIHGIDDSHRLYIVGYNQERPIFDGQDMTNMMFLYQSSVNRDSFITLQRITMRNSQTSCVRLGWAVAGDKRGNYFDLVDCLFYRCASLSNGSMYSGVTDGAFYYLNVDHGFIHHVSVEESRHHAYKIGDGASDILVEWSVAYRVGWWPGKGDWVRRGPVAFDFPNDNNVVNSSNIILRYSIADQVHNYCLQVRRVWNFDIHHNEFSNCIFHDQRPPSGGTIGKYSVILIYGHTFGSFYSNVLRDPGSSDTSLLYVSISDNFYPTIITNNLMYNSTGYAFRGYGLNPTGFPRNWTLTNNLFHSQGREAIRLQAIEGEEVIFKRNVIMSSDVTTNCIDFMVGNGTFIGNINLCVPNNNYNGRISNVQVKGFKSFGNEKYVADGGGQFKISKIINY